MDANYFHVAIVVESLEKSREAFKRTMGLEFTEPSTVELNVALDGEVAQRTLQVSFSTAHRPYIELIQRTETPWDQLGLNHVGAWCEHPESEVAAIVEQGGRIVTRRVHPDGTPLGFIYIEMPGGGVIEVVDSARKADMQAIMGPDVRVI
ncbi:VOC family protein [Nocardioides sp. WS12]|uniref:VOC family protein n=1 Tax=Nocardioides sp. WS12 TaxID=2486272 RepID=UPI0015F7B0C2|nr:VOC family protein [Nocardioides sp. WS12]